MFNFGDVVQNHYLIFSPLKAFGTRQRGTTTVQRY
jgi:hypothetical protein